MSKPLSSPDQAPRLSATEPRAWPLCSVDVVIFTVRDDALQVLLLQRSEGPREPFPGAWSLPGGFIDVDQDGTLEDCARRKLLEKTGVSSPYLEQLGSWGNAHRDPRGWSTTHVYFALIPDPTAHLTTGERTADLRWAPVDGSGLEPLRLAFDHQLLLAAAVQRLRSKVEYTSLPAFLLAEPFTLPQLQRIYEVVLGRAVDKSGFRTRMLAAQFLEETGPVDGSSRRPAMGYRLRDRQHAVVFPRTFSPRSGE